jgi:hypothetical protein
VKVQLVFGQGVVEKVEELRSEDDTQSLDVKEKVGSGRNPPGTIESQSATGNETVQMKVIPEGLVPGVKDRQETDLSMQMGPPEIGQRFGNRFEEDVEQDFLIGENQRIQFVRKRENEVEVTGR